MTDTTSNPTPTGEQTPATIDATASAWGLPAAGRDDLRLRVHERPRPAAAPVRQGHTAPVGRVRPHRLERRRRLGEPARRSRREHHALRHAVLGADERPRTRRGAPPPGRRGSSRSSCTASRARSMCASKIVNTVPDDRREVLRRDAGDRRGPARRGVRPLPAREARARLPAEHQPAVAARRRAHRQPLGHDVPRDAGAHRRSRARRVRA